MGQHEYIWRPWVIMCQVEGQCDWHVMHTLAVLYGTHSPVSGEESETMLKVMNLHLGRLKSSHKQSIGALQVQRQIKHSTSYPTPASPRQNLNPSNHFHL